MFGHVMPISWRKNVTMLFSETSLGTCTSLTPPSSHSRKPLSRWVPKLEKNSPKPSASPWSRLLANSSGSSAICLTTFLILATTAQNAAGGMPSSSSSPSMMNLTGSSMKRLIALTMRPIRPPAFLRSSAISARTSSTAALELAISSLLKLSRVATTSSCKLVELAVELRLLLLGEGAHRLGQVGEDLGDACPGVGDDQVAGDDDRVHLGGDLA